ncbi:CBS domain-containing protein [Paraburkholderia sp. RL17-373-BIF-A]|uniref:CBS domain-containing protein n=1 Tax=Paraburkholderia sp. RL17-373-BIF-A TaxID=3031629 RepID=UPI0038B6C49C
MTPSIMDDGNAGTREGHSPYSSDDQIQFGSLLLTWHTHRGRSDRQTDLTRSIAFRPEACVRSKVFVFVPKHPMQGHCVPPSMQSTQWRHRRCLKPGSIRVDMSNNQELKVKVNEIHSQGTVHIPMTCNLREAAIQMREQHVGALVITDRGASGRMIGIVTDRDIVLKAVASSASPECTAVADVMSTSVVAINENADVTVATQTMSTHGVRRLVVTRDGQEIVGILSLDDLIDAIARDWAMLAGIVRCEQNRERSASVQTPLHM